jgi:hypothetical protein
VINHVRRFFERKFIDAPEYHRGDARHGVKTRQAVLAEYELDMLTLLIAVWTVWKEQELAEQEKRRKQEAELKAQRKNIAEEIRKQRLGESSG